MNTAIAASNLAQEVMRRCRVLASFSEDSAGTRRSFLSPPMHEVHREISRWLQPLGVNMRLDAMGNLRAVYPAAVTPAPRLLIGSHLDTVPNAGAYDGILGVMIAIALLEALHGRRLPYAIEVVGFSDEEGIRFGIPFLGSRALVGRIDEELLMATDAAGVCVREAIAQFGRNPDELAGARLASDVCGYLEFHIEQGPALEKLDLPLAVVDAIAGQTRLEVTFVGRANHAGTTPMDSRCDAIAGAAEWIMLVEREANAVTGLVATVGSVRAHPGAANVIAGEAHLSLDIRHHDDATRNRAVKTFVREARQIAANRGLTLRHATHLDQPAVAMDRFLSDQIEAAIQSAGCRPHRMTSGAGHDAMILTEKVPAAMIFLRTPGGISHDPAESVAPADVEKAIACGVHLLDQLASTPAFLTRTLRA
ncbi:MAG TPA: allantoate amidohydrolase [Verrucomicrobiae bacterium]|nr:allantoate amidohydrolase [Verrucomicrobiae bacterium]